MRRKAPTLPISTTQLKHFAAATVALTAMLAMFAGGGDATVAAQISATQAKNDLVAQEQERIGTKKIATNLRVRKQVGGFGPDESGDSTSGGSSGGSGGGTAAGSRAGPSVSKREAAFLPPLGLQHRPGGTLIRKSKLKPGQSGLNGTTPEPGSTTAPDMSQIGAAIDASRMRSGSGNTNGD